MDFDGKVVLITGAAGGIGKETAKAFAEQGAKLVLVDLQEESLSKTVSELNLDDGSCVTVAADVSKEEDVKNYVDTAVQKFGKIDVFFNNAGIEGKVGYITDTDISVLDQVLGVNVRGVFAGLKHVLKVMKDQNSGAIVNTASVAGFGGSPGLASYVSSKHAVLGLTKSAALESADYGVRVNAVCPAPVNTRMMRSIEAGVSEDNAEGAKKEFEKGIPMNRYAEASEIAQLVLFLASEKAGFITGGAYRIDGGMSAL